MVYFPFFPARSDERFMIIPSIRPFQLASIVKWIRRCRNGAIRNEDEYVFIIMVLIRRIYAVSLSDPYIPTAIFYLWLFNDGFKLNLFEDSIAEEDGEVDCNVQGSDGCWD